MAPQLLKSGCAILVRVHVSNFLVARGRESIDDGMALVYRFAVPQSFPKVSTVKLEIEILLVPLCCTSSSEATMYRLLQSSSWRQPPGSSV